MSTIRANNTIWEKQWNDLVQKAFRQLSYADVETKSRFSAGLAEIPYTALHKTRGVVKKLRRLMERIGFRSL
jgi:hypothetical protein